MGVALLCIMDGRLLVAEGSLEKTRSRPGLDLLPADVTVEENARAACQLSALISFISMS